MLEPDPLNRGKIRQATLLLAGHHFAANPGSLFDLREDRIAISCDPQAGGADRRDGEHAGLLRLGDHLRDRVRGPVDGLAPDLTGRLEALAEPSQLGAVDHAVPRAVDAALGDVELHRVRPDVDDRKARGLLGQQRPEPGRVRRVDEVAETGAADRGNDRRRVFALDRDRARLPPIGDDIGHLGRAAADRVADPPLVDLDRGDSIGRRR